MLRLQNQMLHNGRAKDGETGMSLGISGSVVGMERMVVCRIACTQSMETAGTSAWYSVCQWASHGNHLAASRRYQRRLRRLLLLPDVGWTQDRIDFQPVGHVDFTNIAASRAFAVGDRRLSDQTVRPESRGGRYPSEPDAWPRRSAVFVWPHLGHYFPGHQASPVGCDGIALAGHALRSQADDGDYPFLASLATICDEAAVGGQAGRVARSDPEKKREKRSGSSSTEVIPNGPFCDARCGSGKS